MTNGEKWDVTLIDDRGHRGPMETDFLNGPRFVVRRRGEDEEAGVVELKIGRVYLASLRDALGAPAGDTTLIYDLLDEAGADEVRQALPNLELGPGDLTVLFVDGAGIDRLVGRARNSKKPRHTTT